MPPSIAAGYSGTPFAQKPGIKEGSQVLLIGAPDDDESLLAPLPPRFVEIKVCAVSEVWSGLKLVVRKELR
jgi:hypothetical protein